MLVGGRELRQRRPRGGRGRRHGGGAVLVLEGLALAALARPIDDAVDDGAPPVERELADREGAGHLLAQKSVPVDGGKVRVGADGVHCTPRPLACAEPARPIGDEHLADQISRGWLEQIQSDRGLLLRSDGVAGEHLV